MTPVDARERRVSGVDAERRAPRPRRPRARRSSPCRAGERVRVAAVGDDRAHARRRGAAPSASRTGAARAALTVKHPAAAHGRLAVDERQVLAGRLDAAVDPGVREASRGLHARSPALMATTRCRPSRPERLVPAVQQVEVLHGLPGGALEQVVDGADRDDHVVVGGRARRGKRSCPTTRLSITCVGRASRARTRERAYASARHSATRAARRARARAARSRWR